VNRIPGSEPEEKTTVTAALSISFQIHGTTVNDTLLRLYEECRDLRGSRYPAELHTYYRLPKEPLSTFQRTALAAGNAPLLPSAMIELDAVKFNADSEPIPGKGNKRAITFHLSRKSPVTVVVEAKLRFPLVADAYSQLLRAMAAFGSQKTEQRLLTPAFQDRLSKLLSEKEATAWNNLRSLAMEPEPEQDEEDQHSTSGHYKYPNPAKRKEIVKHYWHQQNAGKISRLDSWADYHHEISAKTLKRYIDEFPEAREEVLEELDQQ
jgi:hypothetical protein